MKEVEQVIGEHILRQRFDKIFIKPNPVKIPMWQYLATINDKITK